MLPKDHVKIPDARVGVILVNLGTPEATDYLSMWRYLREFLSDKRVIEVPRMIWIPILYFIILIFRPKKSGKCMKKYGTEKRFITVKRNNNKIRDKVSKGSKKRE